jgi:hypothetical protein
MPPKKKTEYTGALATPIHAHPLALDSTKYTQAHLMVDMERRRKLPLLFEHFGIDSRVKNAFSRLAYHLAIRHVPGFSIGKSRGRHRKNDPAGLVFWAKVRLRKLEVPKLSTKQAINYVEGRRSGKSIDALRKIYERIDKPRRDFINDKPKDKLAQMLRGIVNGTLGQE